MERCPVCRARLGGRLICRRCGCDLNRAIVAERRARGYLARALEALRAGSLEAAREAAEEALRWDSSQAVRATVAFVRRQAKDSERAYRIASA